MEKYNSAIWREKWIAAVGDDRGPGEAKYVEGD